MYNCNNCFLCSLLGCLWPALSQLRANFDPPGVNLPPSWVNLDRSVAVGRPTWPQKTSKIIVSLFCLLTFDFSTIFVHATFTFFNMSSRVFYIQSIRALRRAIAHEKRFSKKNHTFYVELDLISLIANPKGGNQALSIRIRGRHVFRVFLSSYEKRFS